MPVASFKNFLLESGNWNLEAKMKQYTDQKIDTEQFAHSARIKYVEFQIAMLMTALKRAVREATAYNNLTLNKYDNLVVAIERNLREWMIKEDENKDFGALKEIIKSSLEEATALMTPAEKEDLRTKVIEEISQLNKAKVLTF